MRKPTGNLGEDPEGEALGEEGRAGTITDAPVRPTGSSSSRAEEEGPQGILRAGSHLQWGRGTGALLWGRGRNTHVDRTPQTQSQCPPETAA